MANTFGESITEYSTTADGDPSPPRGIEGADTSLDFPDGLDVDNQGNIYVSNEFGNSVKVFVPNASGDATPQSTISGAATGLSARGPLAVSPPLSVRTAALAEATVGRNYSVTLRAAFGKPPYRWSVARGKLPPGLQLHAKKGVLSGRPTRLPIQGACDRLLASANGRDSSGADRGAIRPTRRVVAAGAGGGRAAATYVHDFRLRRCFLGLTLAVDVRRRIGSRPTRRRGTDDMRSGWLARLVVRSRG